MITARQILHELTAEHVNLDRPISVDSFDYASGDPRAVEMWVTGIRSRIGVAGREVLELELTRPTLDERTGVVWA